MIGAAIDKGGSLKSPAEVTIDGKPYISVEAAAARSGLSYNGLMTRIYNGKVQGAVDYKHDPRRQATKYLPADIEIPGPSKANGRKAAKQRRLDMEARKTAWQASAENDAIVNGQGKPKVVNSSFPALSVDADGVPFPAKVNSNLPAVKCSDCPHCADKAKKCYALALHMTEKGEPKYHSCHRIGRIVVPMQGWEKFTAKGESYKGNTPIMMTKAQEEGLKMMLEHDVAPKPIIYFEAKNVPNISPADTLKAALLTLEAEAQSLEEEAEELEAQFESMMTRASLVKKAAEALRAIGA